MELVSFTVFCICFQYRMVQDVAELSNEAKAVELVHKAAYRTGLGNSIISPAHMVRWSPENCFITIFVTSKIRPTDKEQL